MLFLFNDMQISCAVFCNLAQFYITFHTLCLLEELFVFGSHEKNCWCLVLKRTLVANSSTIENKRCGRVSYHCCYYLLLNYYLLLFNHFNHSRETGCGRGRTTEQGSKLSAPLYPPNLDIPQKRMPSGAWGHHLRYM